MERLKILNKWQALTTAFEAKDYLDCIDNLQKRGIIPLEYTDNLDEVGSYSVSTVNHLELVRLRSDPTVGRSYYS